MSDNIFINTAPYDLFRDYRYAAPTNIDWGTVTGNTGTTYGTTTNWGTYMGEPVLTRESETVLGIRAHFKIFPSIPLAVQHKFEDINDYDWVRKCKQHNTSRWKVHMVRNISTFGAIQLVDIPTFWFNADSFVLL